MPILLDPCRVISLDRVDQYRRFGKLDGKLVFATAQRARSADLVEAAGFHQIHVAQVVIGPLRG